MAGGMDLIWIRIFLLIAVTGSALWDLRTGRIPNRWLLAWCFLLGIGRAAICRGSPWEAGILYGADICFAAICFFPLFLFRMMGAGDIKLMALITGALGKTDGMEVIFCSLAASAVWSLIVMTRKRILWNRIMYFLNYVEELARMGEMRPYYDRERDGKEPAFCFAPFLLLGYGIWMAGKGGIV